MWYVRKSDEVNEEWFYNKKENAVECAKEIYNDFIHDVWETVENFEEECCFNYKELMKEIETGNYFEIAVSCVVVYVLL